MSVLVAVMIIRFARIRRIVSGLASTYRFYHFKRNKLQPERKERYFVRAKSLG